MSKEKISGIYEIRNIINNKVYIGSSKDVYERWKKHKNDLKNHNHHSEHLQHAWNKYGEKNFKFSIIEKCQFNDLIIREQYYIDYYKSSECDYGYNMSKIAGRPCLTKEQLSKMSKSLSEKFKGENCWCNIYSEEQILSLIKDLKTGNYSYKQLSDIHKISYDIVASVASHSSWKYLTKNIDFPKPKISTRKNVKLSENDIKRIITLIFSGYQNKDIADMYSVHPKTISDIRNHKTWTHLTSDIIFQKSKRIYKNKYIDKVKKLKLDFPNWSYQKIANELDISSSYVCALLNKS